MAFSFRDRLVGTFTGTREATEAKPQSSRLPIEGLLVSVALNAAGQILFKAAHTSAPDASLVQLFLHPQIWAGIIVYGLSALVWLWVLSRAHLSFAYPVLSLTFPIVVALSGILFAEQIPLLRWVGVAVIVSGVSLLAST